jgi:phage gp29-like protein
MVHRQSHRKTAPGTAQAASKKASLFSILHKKRLTSLLGDAIFISVMLGNSN